MAKLIRKIETVLACLIIYSVLLVVVLGVLWRYVFNRPIVWVEEVSNMLYVWIVFIGAAFAYLEGDMVRMDFIHDLFPPVVRKIVDICFDALIALCCAYLIPHAWRFLVIISRVETMILRISWGFLFWPGLFMTVSFAILGAVKTIRGILDFRGKHGIRS